MTENKSNLQEKQANHNMQMQTNYMQFSKKITVAVVAAVFVLAVAVMVSVLTQPDPQPAVLNALLNILQTMSTFGSVTIGGYMVNSGMEKITSIKYLYSQSNDTIPDEQEDCSGEDSDG